MNYAELAQEAARIFSRDSTKKHRILQRHGDTVFALDADEVGQMSPGELARRVLRSEHKLEVSDRSDPEEVLSAIDAVLERRRGGGSSMDGAAETFVDRYINYKG